MKALARLLPVLLFLFCSCAYAGQVSTFTVYFDKDQCHLSTREARKLLVLKGADLVMLKGHTDNDGDAAYNLDLSQKRVEEVRSFVHKLDTGIRTEISFYGLAQPLNSNLNESEKTVNRRVEISYISNPLLRANVPLQSFAIDNSKEEVLTCKHGTVIKVPAGAFGNCEVDIKVNEYYNPLEILSANLTTKSNGAPLETGGMIHLVAQSDGEDMQPSIPLSVTFPGKGADDGYQTFNGNRKDDYNMDWKPEEATVTIDTSIPLRNLRGINLEMKYGNCEGVVYLVQSDYQLFNRFRSGAKRVIDAIKAWKSTAGLESLKNARVDIEINNAGKVEGVGFNKAGETNFYIVKLQSIIYSNLPEGLHSAYNKSVISILFGPDNIPSNLVFGADGTGGERVEKPGCWGRPNNISLKISNVGWINCDRFIKNTNLANFSVQCDTDANLYMIMKNYNSFFGSDYAGLVNANDDSKEPLVARYIFHKVPLNEPVVLISAKRVKDQLYFAIENTSTSAAEFTQFHYKAMTQAELEEAIRHLKDAS